MDLLELHPSFWTGEIVSHSSPRITVNTRRVRTEKSFWHWQALRRNKAYDKWAFDLFIENKDYFCGKSLFDKYFTPYPPTDPSENYTRWRARIMDETRRLKTSEELEWEIRAKQVVWGKVPKCLPSRWLPIPSQIEFPHPDVLRMLTPMQAGLCVSPVLFRSMTQIKVADRRLWVDLSCSLQQIIREILSYESFLRIETNKKRTEVRREAKMQLKEALRHRPRTTIPTRKRKRKRTQEPPRLARIFVTWDMKQDGKSYSDIAKTLWPKDFKDAKSQGRLRKDGNRQAIIQRAKDHYKDAERRINLAFRL